MLTDLVRSWRDELTRLDPRLRDVVISCDHGDFAHFSFDLGEVGHEAISADLTTFLFVDELGYFDDGVPAAGVPRRLAELFAVRPSGGAPPR